MRKKYITGHMRNIRNIINAKGDQFTDLVTSVTAKEKRNCSEW